MRNDLPISPNKKFKYSISFESWDEESLEAGQSDVRGYEIEGDIDTIGDILNKANTTYGIYYPLSFGGWESTEPEEDRDFWEKGIHKYYALHITNEDGTQISQEESDFISFLLSDGRYEIDKFRDYAVGGIVLGAVALGVGALITYFYFKGRKGKKGTKASTKNNAKSVTYTINGKKRKFPIKGAWKKEHSLENKSEDYEVPQEDRFAMGGDASEHYHEIEYGDGGIARAKEIITKKIGLNEENADFLTAQSEKFAIWFADSIVKAQMSIGKELTKEQVVEFLNKNPNTLKGLRQRIRGILDWLENPNTPKQNLRELTFDKAESKAKQWHDELIMSGGDIDYVEPKENIILKTYPTNEFGKTYYWVMLPSNICDLESSRMGHCGKSYNSDNLISFRSTFKNVNGEEINDSHITLGYGDGLFYQAKGKQNKKPLEKYFPYIFDFIKSLVKGEIEDLTFNGFASEYASKEDYGWEDMTKQELTELYELNPNLFSDFAGKYMLYQAGLSVEKPNTTIVIEKSPEYVADLLRLDRDLSEEVVEKVLTGETHDWFSGSDSWGYYYDNADDYVDDLNESNYEAVIDKIVELTGLEKSVVKENGAKHYLAGDDEEFDKDNFDDISRAIGSAMANGEENAYVKYYYEQIESALSELGTIKKLNYDGVEIEIDLENLMSISAISSFLKDLDTDSLEDVFFEAESQGEIELPKLRIDDRYSAYPDDEDFNANFDVDMYEKGGSLRPKSTTTKKNKIKNMKPSQRKLAKGGNIETGISKEDYFLVVHNWVYFTFNYPHNFVKDAFDSKHLEEKFSSSYTRYGSVGVLMSFWANLDGDNRRILSLWIKNNYFSSSDDKSKLLTISDDDYAKIITHWNLFCFNFPYGFLDKVFEENTSHFEHKWLRAYESAGSTGAVNKFFTELSMNNQKLLTDWVFDNYKGVSLYAGGGGVGNTLPKDLKKRLDNVNKYLKKYNGRELTEQQAIMWNVLNNSSSGWDAGNKAFYLSDANDFHYASNREYHLIGDALIDISRKMTGVEYDNIDFRDNTEEENLRVYNEKYAGKFDNGGGVDSNYGKYGDDNSNLVNFDVDNLDDFEIMQYRHISKSMSKAEALQILINSVEGDYSQLSEELSEIAEEQMPMDEYAGGGKVKGINKKAEKLLELSINYSWVSTDMGSGWSFELQAPFSTNGIWRDTLEQHTYLDEFSPEDAGFEDWDDLSEEDKDYYYEEWKEEFYQGAFERFKEECMKHLDFFVEYLQRDKDDYESGGRVTKYVRVYIVQGNYGQGWEDLTAHDNRKDARAEMRVYDDNERYAHRVIERRVLRSDYEKGNYEVGGQAETFKKGGILGESARLEYITDAYASLELRDELKEAIGLESEDEKLGDKVVISFAYTDYGGDFLDKVAIAYFSEYYPNNIIKENSGWGGENAYVFGEPAQEWIEQTEDYPLGFDDIESYYYEKTAEQEEEDFNYFLDEISGEYTYDRESVLDWLLENRGGYYGMTTQGLDFSWEDLTEELVNEGLIEKTEEDEEEYAGGGDLGDAKSRLNELDSDGNTSVEYDEENEEWYWEDYSNDSYRGGFSSELEAYEDLVDYLENNSDEDEYAEGGEADMIYLISDNANPKREISISEDDILAESRKFFKWKNVSVKRIKSLGSTDYDKFIEFLYKKGYGKDEYAGGGETYQEKVESIRGGVEEYSVDIDLQNGDNIRDITSKSLSKAKKEYDKYSETMIYDGEKISNIQLIVIYKDNDYDTLISKFSDEYADGGEAGKKTRKKTSKKKQPKMVRQYFEDKPYSYAGGGKVGMINYYIGGLVSEDIPFEYNGEETDINYEVGFHEGGIDSETFKETPSGYYVRIMPYGSTDIRRFIYPEKDIEIAYLSELRAITMLLFEANKDTKENQKIAIKEGKKNLPKLLKYMNENLEEEDRFRKNVRIVQDAMWGSDEDEEDTEEYAGGGEVEDWMEEALASLIEETGYDDLEISYVVDSKIKYEFIASDGDVEYRVFKTEDDAEQIAVEQVLEDLKENPDYFNQDWLMNYIDGRDFFEEALNEMNDGYVQDIESESDRKYANRLIAELVENGLMDEEDAESDNAEELADELKYDYVALLTEEKLDEGNDGLDYFINNFGESETYKMVMDNNLINVDEASQDAVQTDGIGHFLSSYDGETLYLSDDYVAYRIN
jgi:hypothetical protein